MRVTRRAATGRVKSGERSSTRSGPDASMGWPLVRCCIRAAALDEKSEVGDVGSLQRPDQLPGDMVPSAKTPESHRHAGPEKRVKTVLPFSPGAPGRWQLCGSAVAR